LIDQMSIRDALVTLQEVSPPAEPFYQK
jgi:hypothetical protein